MKRLRIGIDCDGVLADFKFAYTTEMQRLYPDVPGLVHNTSQMLGWEVTLWPGVTQEMRKATWKFVTNSRDWWLTLAPLANFAERQAITLLTQRHDVFIITARRDTKGYPVSHQTWRWLGNHGIHGVSVIVTEQKGLVAHALDLDFFLDDKPSNCEEVNEATNSCKVFLREWNWNSRVPMNWNIGSVKSLVEFLSRIQEVEATRDHPC